MYPSTEFAARPDCVVRAFMIACAMRKPTPVRGLAKWLEQFEWSPEGGPLDWQPFRMESDFAIIQKWASGGHSYMAALTDYSQSPLVESPENWFVGLVDRLQEAGAPAHVMGLAREVVQLCDTEWTDSAGQPNWSREMAAEHYANVMTAIEAKRYAGYGTAYQRRAQRHRVEARARYKAERGI